MERMDGPTIFRERFKECRKALGWSQVRAAQECGINSRAIERLEAGGRWNPTMGMVTAMARALGVSPLYLAGWDGINRTHGLAEWPWPRYARAACDASTPCQSQSG